MSCLVSLMVLVHNRIMTIQPKDISIRILVHKDKTSVGKVISQLCKIPIRVQLLRTQQLVKIETNLFLLSIRAISTQGSEEESVQVPQWEPMDMGPTDLAME